MVHQNSQQKTLECDPVLDLNDKDAEKLLSEIIVEEIDKEILKEIENAIPRTREFNSSTLDC